MVSLLRLRDFSLKQADQWRHCAIVDEIAVAIASKHWTTIFFCVWFEFINWFKTNWTSFWVLRTSVHGLCFALCYSRHSVLMTPLTNQRSVLKRAQLSNDVIGPRSAANECRPSSNAQVWILIRTSPASGWSRTFFLTLGSGTCSAWLFVKH